MPRAEASGSLVRCTATAAGSSRSKSGSASMYAELDGEGAELLDAGAVELPGERRAA